MDTDSLDAVLRVPVLMISDVCEEPLAMVLGLIVLVYPEAVGVRLLGIALRLSELGTPYVLEASLGLPDVVVLRIIPLRLGIQLLGTIEL